jgi:Sec-independent protein translocase protein TatA
VGNDVLIVLLVILGAVVVWRGPKTLPKLGAALGRGVREARSEAGRQLEDKPEPAEPAEPADAGDRPDRPPDGA